MAQRKKTNAPRGSAADNLALMALCRHSGLSTGKLAEALEKDYGLTLSGDALGALLRRPDIRLYRLEQRRQAVAAAERFAQTWAKAAAGDEAARADLAAQLEAEAVQARLNALMLAATRPGCSGWKPCSGAALTSGWRRRSRPRTGISSPG